jgi:hypothetical protein
MTFILRTYLNGRMGEAMGFGVWSVKKLLQLVEYGFGYRFLSILAQLWMDIPRSVSQVSTVDVV